jgi:SAM-dependent methyltransferase
VEEWGESLPFADQSFDVVHARQVLHHAANLQKLCAEIARVLKPQGVFIATREHVVSSHMDLPVFLASHPLHAFYGGENAFLLEEYLRAIRAGGLRIRQVLSPLETDINLYPSTVIEARGHLAGKLRIPLPERLLHWLLVWRSRRSKVP